MGKITVKGMDNGTEGSPIYFFSLSDTLSSQVWADALNGIIDIPGASSQWKTLTMERLRNAASDLPFQTIISKLSQILKRIPEIPPEFRMPIILSSLSIAFSESRFNGRAIANIKAQINDYLHASRIYLRRAKGYFQLLPGTFSWMAKIYNNTESRLRKLMDKADVLAAIRAFSPSEAKEIQVVGQPYTMNLNEPASQIIPSIAYLLHSAFQIFKDWQWDDVNHQWVPREPFANDYLLVQVNNLVPGALRDKELGIQLLMTLYHVNGINCLHQRERNNFAYAGVGAEDNRYANDIANYIALRQIITPESIREIFNI